jgi:hypothetical protein
MCNYEAPLLSQILVPEVTVSCTVTDAGIATLALVKKGKLQKAVIFIPEETRSRIDQCSSCAK